MNESKLVRIFLMLGSTNDGEVINAARHLGRWLEANGKDWHSLAAHMGRFEAAAPTATAMRPARPRGPVLAYPKPKPVPRNTGRSMEDMVADLAEYRDGSKPLTTVERSHVRQMALLFSTYGNKAYLNARQTEWTIALHRKYITKVDTDD
jgi:hypothetical protein